MDDLSREFVAALSLAFPKWKDLAKDVRDEETGAEYIEVEVPQEGTARALRLSTGEITMSFDYWHTHEDSIETALSILV